MNETTVRIGLVKKNKSTVRVNEFRFETVGEANLRCEKRSNGLKNAATVRRAKLRLEERSND